MRNTHIALVCVFALCLSFWGCSGAERGANKESAKTRKTAQSKSGQSTNDFGTCEPKISGTSVVGETTKEKTKIRRLDYELDMENVHFKIELFNKRDNSIGRVQLQQVVEQKQAQYGKFKAQIRGPDGETVRAYTQMHVGGENYRVNTRLTGYDRRLELWVTYNDNDRVSSLSWATPKTGQHSTSIGTQMSTADGEYRVLPVLEPGQQAPLAKGKQKEWASDLGVGKLYSGPLTKRLNYAILDSTFLGYFNEHLKQCLGRGSQTRQQSLTRKMPVLDQDCSTWGKASLWAGTALNAAVCIGGAIGSFGVGAGIACVGLGVSLYNMYQYHQHNQCDPMACAQQCSGGSGQCNADAECECNPDNCQGGCGGGDPHLTTFDGVAYDFQAVGEFTLFETTIEAPAEFQVRQQPVEGATCPNVSYYTGIATEMAGKTVNLYARRDEPVWVDGKPVDFFGVDYPVGDHAITKSADDSYRLRWDNGTVVNVKDSGHFFNIDVKLSSQLKGNVRGLLGTKNNVPEDDFELRNGRELEWPLEWKTINGSFADSWRISEGESLFHYKDGNSTEDYQNPQLPGRPQEVEYFSKSERDSARQTCASGGVPEGRVMEDCMLDIICTGNSAYVEAHADRAPPEQEAPVEKPIYFDNWTQEGPDSNGNWSVSSNGRSVEQTTDGKPTFFVSARSFEEVYLNGEMTIKTGSRDTVGFVVGHHKPIESEGNSPREVDTYVLSWQQQEDAGAKEGFTLAKVSDYNRDTLWKRNETEDHQVIATDYGEEKGWEPGETHSVELSVSGDRLQFAVDSQKVFDIDVESSEVSSFQPGRIGFYADSQPDATYSQFRILDKFEEITTNERFVSGDFEFVAPPESVKEGDSENTNRGIVFPEKKGVVLDETVPVDRVFRELQDYQCTLPKSGIRVNSYLVHVDPSNDGQTFKGRLSLEEDIVALVTDTFKNTDDIFGRPGVAYQTPARKLESRDSVEFYPESNSIEVTFKTTGAVDQIRVLTLPQTASTEMLTGDVPRSCAGYAAEGVSSDGVYEIDPDGQGGVEPFETYCQFSDDGTAWTMASKTHTGSEYKADCTWGLGTATGKTQSMEPSKKGRYGNRIVNQFWNKNEFNIRAVRVGLYKDGDRVRTLRFDGRNTRRSGWFTEENLIESPWMDVKSEPNNVFGLLGDGRRDFYINRDYGGCASDHGWMVATTNSFCDWDDMRQPESAKDKLNILYSTTETYENFTTGSIKQADTIVVSVSRSEAAAQTSAGCLSEGASEAPGYCFSFNDGFDLKNSSREVETYGNVSIENGSAVFNESQDYIQVKDVDKTDDFVVSTLVQTAGEVDGEGNLIHYGGEGSYKGWGLSHTVDHSFLWTEGNSRGSTESIIKVDQPPAPQDWRHFLGVKRGQKLHFYIDGMKVESRDLSYSEIGYREDSIDLTIGRHEDFDARYFEGRIDFVGVWTSGLSESDVSTLLQNVQNTRSNN